MRKFFLTLLTMSALPFVSHAQNVFPASGNVGIGTSSPQYPLHVVTGNTVGLVTWNTGALANNSGAFIRAYNAGTPAGANMRLGGLLFGTVDPSAMVSRTGAQIEAYSEAAWTATSQPSFMRFLTTPADGTSPLERMRITAEGHVVLQQGTFFGVAISDRYPYDGRTQPHYGLQWVMDSWSSSGPTLWASAFGGMKFMTQSVPRITITGTGNVGIGTDDTKGYKFAVNGDAIFTKIKVKANASWPDYVFEESYQLPPLAEIAAYIKTHKHLPEIPAAAEIEKDGQDVGEMNRQLLKKVEELTLYLIQQQQEHENTAKRIKVLEEDNKRMSREIEALKAK